MGQNYKLCLTFVCVPKKYIEQILFSLSHIGAMLILCKPEDSCHFYS